MGSGNLEIVQLRVRSMNPFAYRFETWSKTRRIFCTIESRTCIQGVINDKTVIAVLGCKCKDVVIDDTLRKMCGKVKQAGISLIKNDNICF